MREVTIKKKVFKFDELDAEVQKEVLEKHRDVECAHHGWWDPIFEGVREDLRAMGFDGNIDIRFSGFGSQGDGASFTCDSIDVKKFVEFHKLKKRFGTLMPAIISGGITGSVVRDKHFNYVHENTVTVHFDFDTVLSSERDIAEELDNYVSSHVRKFCCEIYTRLEKYNSELSSDERIKEWLEENVGEFEENGDIYVDEHLETSEEE